MPPDLDQITQRLERVERNADRQQQVDLVATIDFEALRDPAQRGDDEIEVFEDEQQAEIRRQPGDQIAARDGAAGGQCHALGTGERHDRRADDQQEVPGIPPGVEDVTGACHQPQAGGSSRVEMEQERERQENEELERVE
jgi:hypothetical protein